MSKRRKDWHPVFFCLQADRGDQLVVDLVAINKACLLLLLLVFCLPRSRTTWRCWTVIDCFLFTRELKGAINKAYTACGSLEIEASADLITSLESELEEFRYKYILYMYIQDLCHYPITLISAVLNITTLQYILLMNIVTIHWFLNLYTSIRNKNYSKKSRK